MLPNAGEGRGPLVGKPEKWVLGVALGALLCLVSACASSSQTPGSTATSSPTDSPTASAIASVATSITPATSPTADPNIPAEARPATMDGAQKFAKYWMSQVNLGLRNADPSLVANLSRPECSGCKRLVSETEQIRDAGQRVDGDLWTVSTSTVRSFDNASSADVLVDFRQNPVALVDAGGVPVSRYKEKAASFVFTAAHDGNIWHVTKLQVAE